MKIAGYENTENVTVEFLDIHKFRKSTAYVNIKSGGVKNHYDRRVRGIGYLGDGFYQPKTKEERKEIRDMYKPSYKEIYDRLAEYERRFSNG